MLVAINEHADTIHLVAADGSQDAVIVLQDNVGVVAKYRRIAINCYVAGPGLVVRIGGFEPAGRLVIFAQSERSRNAPAASMRIFQRRARLVHDIAHEIGTPRLLGALAELGAGRLRLEFGLR